MANLTVSTDVDNFMQAADNAAARTSLGVPASTTTISAGTGLTGGGDLSANRTLTVSYGTTAGTAAQGDDARLSNARTPTTHASTHQSGGSDQITSLALTTGTITTTPGSANDIVNKSYADSIGSGVNFHDACDYGTIAVLSPAANYNQPGGAGVGVNATLTGSTNVPLVVDGVTVATGKRILVKNQTSTFQNGIYTVTQQGDNATVPYILTRASDYDTSGSGTNEVQAGDFVIVLNSTLANTAWVQQTPAPINFGVTAITFIQFAAANPGVTSFTTSLSGLTPSSNTTGAVTLAGTLGVGSGGTGATTQQAALNALSGAQTSGYHFRSDGTNVSLQPMSVADVTAGTLAVANGGTGQTTNEGARNALGSIQNATVRHGSTLVLQILGTLTGAVYNSGSAVITFTSSSVTLVPGMSLSILTSAVIKTVDSPTQVTMTAVSGASGSGSANVFNSTTSTLVSSSIITMDNKTMVVGDIVILTAQTANAQNGPWILNSLAGSVMSFVRPSYWSGTIFGNALFYIQQGVANFGQIVSVSGSVSTGSTVGLDSFSVYTATQRGSNAVTGSNNFTGKQTFQAGATGSGAVPFAFQAGVLMTAPQAHSVEWDGTLMYLTTSAAVRTTNVVSTVVPSTSTSAGVVGQIAVDNTNNWLYVCTAANVWKRVALTTF